MNPPDLTVARGHLRSLALDLMGRLDGFLGSHDEDVPNMIDSMSLTLVTDMADARAETSATRARRLVINPEPEFWLTDLGRLISRSIGYGAPVVPRAHAAVILGVSRQRISQLEHATSDRRLETATNLDGTSGVSNDSLLGQLSAAGKRG